MLNHEFWFAADSPANPAARFFKKTRCAFLLLLGENSPVGFCTTTNSRFPCSYSADEADAVQAADFLGKKRIVKRSWGHSAGKSNVSYSETEEYKIKPHKLRNLRDHECVLVHCERGFRRVTLPPLEADGSVAKWFPWWRRLL